MIPRHAQTRALQLSEGFPIVALTGPRQSGKTTLARALFPDRAYVSLEDPEEREFSLRDPRGFLARFNDGAIIDEAQRVPDLFSYLQTLVDSRRRMGDFILTGSQQFGLRSGISQSLAGRVGLIQLLPFSMSELAGAGLLAEGLDELMWRGGYPPLYDRPLTPDLWFPNYVATYLERDVRQVLGVRDLDLFQRFVKLCAARTGQLLNLSSLAADCGISHVTAREWLSVLEASYIAIRLPPYFRNFGKRLVKTPKLYFLDPGLAAWLIGIRDSETLNIHAQRGALFETLVVSEFIKQRYNQGQPADLYFWRDNVGHEIDLLFESGRKLQAVEVKSGATFAADWLVGVNKWRGLTGEDSLSPWIVYGGNEGYQRQGARVLAWKELAGLTAGRENK
ncbi:MAG: ATP-binding protein [Proteobacteria bacterium]|nr:ATP-binding protein [Pseudomonadota bacterium]MBU1739559.1 ATP-binding protein [Pseudomonadota bacterium]